MGWGPVDWWEESSQKQNLKKMDFVFLICLILATVTEISVEIRKCDGPTNQPTYQLTNLHG